MRLALHWQIFIGLIFGVVFGILFPTNYKISNESINQLKEKNLPENVIVALSIQLNKRAINKSSFAKQLQTAIGNENFNTYGSLIIEQSKFNPYLPYISWFGDLFLRALKMLIVPLVLSSIISGMAHIGNAENLYRLAGKTILYYTLTSIFAIAVSLFFVNLLKPGVGVEIGMNNIHISNFNVEKLSFKDTIMSIIPGNIFQIFAEGKLLAIIFFSVLFGFFVTTVKDRNRLILQNFFSSVFEVMMKITRFIIKFTPIGIIGIVAVIVSEQSGDIKSFISIASGMASFMFTVLIVLLFHSVISLPLFMKYAFKASPKAHFNAMKAALITAFSTSSTVATLPLTILSVEKGSGVSNKISSFTLPLGVSINLDGTIIFACISAIFISQSYGIELSILDQVIIVATAYLASFGAAGIPLSGIVILTLILTAVGLPLEGIGLIIASERFLNMLISAVNVWSDSVIAIVIAKSEGEFLKV